MFAFQLFLRSSLACRRAQPAPHTRWAVLEPRVMPETATVPPQQGRQAELNQAQEAPPEGLSSQGSRQGIEFTWGAHALCSEPHSREHKPEQAKAKDFSVVQASALVLVMAKPKSLLDCTAHAWHKMYLWLIWLTRKPLWLLAMVLCFLFYLSRLKLWICKYLKSGSFSLETELMGRQNLLLSITTTSHNPWVSGFCKLL